ncbi:MAG: hypothetical protein M1447_10455 [Gammaproteobacteria bacterium]|nr:hypothetical protein [Ferrimicrobium acidiphilum]MCL5054207.1 hypothetical protein [Gammaproteobacteria bacterium]
MSTKIAELDKPTTKGQMGRGSGSGSGIGSGSGSGIGSGSGSGIGSGNRGSGRRSAPHLIQIRRANTLGSEHCGQAIVAIASRPPAPGRRLNPYACVMSSPADERDACVQNNG